MKNVIKPISALASVRTRLGLTQDQMAEQLGFSKSMVKMIETNKRFLSSDSLVKLAALEIRMAAMPATGKAALPTCLKELYDNDMKEYAGKTSMHEVDCNYKALHLERKLKKMQAEHDGLVSSLHNIESVTKIRPGSEDQLNSSLWLHRARLLDRLSRCSPQEQAILKNRIALLYAEVSLKKSIHPRYVHTNEEPTIF